MMVWSERAATCGAANAESVERPIAGLPAASAMPRAAEIPTRKPVKLPGPTVTAMRSTSVNSQRAASITPALARREAKAAARRNSDAKAGETARPDSHGYAIDFGKLAARRIHHPRDQGHEGFGMAALHAERFACNDCPGGRIQDGRRAGTERGIDSENAHECERPQPR